MLNKTIINIIMLSSLFLAMGCEAGFIDTGLEKEQRTKEETTIASEEQQGAIDLKNEFVQLKQKEKEQELGIVPANLRIPAIKVEASVMKVGLLDNGQMGVPDNEEDVAWFEPGTKPGNTGNAVLAAHVDSREGPAVFWDLKKMEPGQEVFVTDEDGTELTFVVKRVERYPRDEAPIKEIFGNANSKNLNLITCTGTFDRANGGHEERLVVYTELKEDKVPENIEKPSSPTNVVVHDGYVTFHAVREVDIVGYRVYRAGEDGAFDLVTSISSHQRKSYTDSEARNYTYYVTAINKQGGESEPSEITKYRD
ncbi:Sortase family protein [Bacillus sp. THAF10]|uniref:class F sortase n=1 Tax=Bacillus sp. THAF10 TaxID=2587848 RepID=UPI0012A9DA17|nr:sortase [Bacillus sp. THAF10]QFT90573.1 Sortase family protein [Bacillus sp. THAF10]